MSSRTSKRQALSPRASASTAALAALCLFATGCSDGGGDASDTAERIDKAEKAAEAMAERAGEAVESAAAQAEASATAGAEAASSALETARERIKDEMAEVRVETDQVAEDAAEVLESVEDEASAAGTAAAKGPTQHVVRAQVTNFSPMVLFVEPGDSVVWQNMAGHNVDSIEGMVPDGATAFQSKLGEEGFSVTFDVPGAYVYKCTPHVSTGMVGAVVVGGDPANLGAIETALEDVKIAQNMVGRGIRKMKKALEEREAL